MNQVADKTPDTQDPTSDPTEAANEAVYDSALADLMASDEADQETANDVAHDAGYSADGDSGTDEGSQDESGGGDDTLTEQQKQLLERLHVPESALEAMSPEQRDQFLKVNKKRQDDQDAAWSSVQDRLKKLEGGDDDPGEGGDGDGDESEGSKPGLEAKAQQVIGDLVEQFGDEMEPLGEVFGEMSSALETSQKEAERLGNMLAEQILDSEINRLTWDHEGLRSRDERAEFIEAFHEAWSKADHSKGSFREQVEQVADEVVSARYSSNKHQNAANARTQNRLKGQIRPGNGKGRAKPKSVDDVYDIEASKFFGR